MEPSHAIDPCHYCRNGGCASGQRLRPLPRGRREPDPGEPSQPLGSPALRDVDIDTAAAAQPISNTLARYADGITDRDVPCASHLAPRQHARFVPCRRD